MTTLPLLPADPTAVGPYRLLGRLGVGGMGVVYLGQDAAGTRAAIKVVRDELAAQPEFRARFAREVSAAAAVRGTRTARVLAADTAGRRQWVATEYVPGLTLDAAVAQRGALGAGEVAALASGLAEALVAVHAAGVVHRDLKPGNVVLGPDGPTVIDFGIARAADATSLTGTGVVLGTLAWMPPEQLLGHTVTPAGDVFGWGLVVAYAARGLHPYGEGRPEAIAFRVLHDAPDLDGLPRALRRAVATALVVDPSRRPTPAELLRMLGVARVSTRVASPTTGGTAPTERMAAAAARRHVGRTRVAAAAAAGVVLLGVVGATVTGLVQTWRPGAADQTAAGDQPAPTPSESPAPSASLTPAPTPSPTPSPTPRATSMPTSAPSPSVAPKTEPVETSADTTSTVAVAADGDAVGTTFASSCTWDPPTPSRGWANRVVLDGTCDDLGKVSVKAEALGSLVSETDESQVLVTGRVGGQDIYLELYPVASAGAPGTGWWAWGGSSNNGRGDAVEVLAARRVEGGQTWWELGSGVDAEAEAVLGLDPVTTMGGAWGRFECVGPRAEGSGLSARWPARGEVRGVHEDADVLSIPIAAALCSIMTHAVPASGIASVSG